MACNRDFSVMSAVGRALPLGSLLIAALPVLGCVGTISELTGAQQGADAGSDATSAHDPMDGGAEAADSAVARTMRRL